MGFTHSLGEFARNSYKRTTPPISKSDRATRLYVVILPHSFWIFAYAAISGYIDLSLNSTLHALKQLRISCVEICIYGRLDNPLNSRQRNAFNKSVHG